MAKSVGKTHPLSTADKFFRSIIDGSNVDGCKQIMLPVIRSIFAGAQFIRGITDGDDADAYKLIQLRIIRSTFTGAQFIRGRFAWNASGAYLRKTLSSQHLPPQRRFALNNPKNHFPSEYSASAASARLEQQKKSTPCGVLLESGGDLLSRAVSSQVPSALKVLTSVFGMGTGGTPSPLPPEIVDSLFPHLDNCTCF